MKFFLNLLVTNQLNMTRQREGNVLFSDPTQLHILRLYRVEHMAKDHSVRKETHCHHFMGYSFQLAAKGLLYATSHIQDGTPVVEHWVEQEIAQWVHHDPLHNEQMLYHRAMPRSLNMIDSCCL